MSKVGSYRLTSILHDQYVEKKFTSRQIGHFLEEFPDADILWVEGKSYGVKTPDFIKNSSITPHVLYPLINFPFKVFIKKSWAEKYPDYLKKVDYPFDYYWLGMLNGATIKVYTLSSERCPPRILYRIKDWFPFGELEKNKEKMITYQHYFHTTFFSQGEK